VRLANGAAAISGEDEDIGIDDVFPDEIRRRARLLQPRFRTRQQASFKRRLSGKRQPPTDACSLVTEDETSLCRATNAAA
jgi:hypothetical protein